MKRIIIVLLPIILIAACSKEVTSVLPKGHTRIGKRSIAEGSLNPSLLQDHFDGIRGSVQISAQIAPTNSIPSTADYWEVMGSLSDENKHEHNLGSFYINQLEVAPPVDNRLYYKIIQGNTNSSGNYFGHTVNVTLKDTGNHSDIFTTSFYAPQNIAINSPFNQDRTLVNVQRGVGVTLHWNADPQNTEGCVIVLTPSSKLLNHNYDTQFLKIAVQDDGSYTIGPEIFSAFDSGTKYLDVYLIRGKKFTVTGTNSLNYLIDCFASSHTIFMLD